MKTLAKTALPLGAASLLFAAIPAQAETKILFNYFVPPKHPAQGRRHRQLVEAGHRGQQGPHQGELPGQDAGAGAAPVEDGDVRDRRRDRDVQQFRAQAALARPGGHAAFQHHRRVLDGDGAVARPQEIFRGQEPVQGRQVPRLRHARGRRVLQPEEPHHLRRRPEEDEDEGSPGRCGQVDRQDRGGGGADAGDQGLRRGLQGNRRRADLPHRRRREAQDDALRQGISPRCRARFTERCSRST